MKKLKKLVLELERELELKQRELENLLRARGGRQERERELEERLEERDRELKELRRRMREGEDLEEVEERNAELEEQLDGARALLQDNMDELERLRDIVARNEENDDLRRRLEHLEAENEELRNQANGQEDLADECETLRLQLEDMQRRYEASTLERSQSRATIMHQEETKDALEDDLNSVRDQYAAAQIELSQKDDELEMKQGEIDDLIQEHQRIVTQLEEEWRGEVDEARGQAEQLKDVSLFTSPCNPFRILTDWCATGAGAARKRVPRAAGKHRRVRGPTSRYAREVRGYPRASSRGVGREGCRDPSRQP